MTQKPRLNFWQIWNMSFGFLGIQFGFELQNSNVSRIFETLGANKDEIPLIWIAAPVTGLLVQPIIGYLSDNTWHPYWGRRRPFFFIGAILAAIALLIMPNSPTLWVAGGMLWIMDAAINISMEPFRAFVGDKLSPEQRTKGFAMQSFFIGVGSVIAAMLPWMFTNLFNVSNTAPAGVIPDAVKWSFYLGAFAFLAAVMYTVFTTKEFPPENLERFREEQRKTTLKMALKESFEGIFKMPKTMKQLAIVQFFTWFALFSMWIYATNAVTSNIYDMKVTTALYEKISGFIKNNTLETGGNASRSEEDIKKEQKRINSLQGDLKEIDRFQSDEEMKILTTNLAGYYLEKGNPDATERATLERVQKEYNTGADWIGVISSVRNGIAALFAFLIPLIARRTNRRITHMLSLMIGGIGLISMMFVTDPNYLMVSMAMVGISWASILSMPYAMLAGALPADKMGYFMGVFNFFIVIPQIVAASILGYFTMQFFHGNTMLTLVLGGVSMILAGLLVLNVEDKDELIAKPHPQNLEN